MATRTQVAAVLAGELKGSNRAAAINRAAAWLVSAGKARQAGYLAKDVAWILQQQGYVFARITVAKQPSSDALEAIRQYIKHQSKAKEVELDIIVDPSVIGGVRIETPSSTLDDTVRNRLAKFVREVEN